MEFATTPPANLSMAGERSNSGATVEPPNSGAERSNSGVTAKRSTELRKTPLNALHRKLGARMVNFGGWDMPVEYPASGGLMAEHKAVRSGVGVFDVSHMGDIRIYTGTAPGGALAAVQHVSMNDASKLVIGKAHYS